MAAPALTPMERIEGLVARGALGLPLAAKRLLGAPPVRIDGLELAPEMRLLLRLMELSGNSLRSDDPVRARAQTVTDARKIERHRRRPRVDVRELSVAGGAGPIAARLYVPAGAPAPSPGLVYFHGGGWTVGDLDSHDSTCRFLAHEAGIRVVAVDYRLAPEDPFPAGVEDAGAAFADIAARAGELGCDPGRLAVGGDSAGGTLAAVTANLARDAGGPAPAFQLLIYPGTDMTRDYPSERLFADGFLLTKAQMDWYSGNYVSDPAQRSDPRVSPILADLAGTAPAYVATAGFDPLRDEGEAYGRALEAAGVPTVIRRHDDLIHGYVNMTEASPRAREAMLEAAGALRVGLAGRPGLPPTAGGSANGMTENPEETTENAATDSERGSTSPPDGKTHEATTPPGQGDLDEGAADEARDKLEQAGGGH